MKNSEVVEELKGEPMEVEFMSLKHQAKVIRLWKAELLTQIEDYEKTLKDFELREFELGVKRMVAGFAKKDNRIEKKFYLEKFVYPIDDEIEKLEIERENLSSKEKKLEIVCLKILIKEIDRRLEEWEAEAD